MYNVYIPVVESRLNLLKFIKVVRLRKYRKIVKFIEVYNYFNYRPFEIIKIYLNEIYEKLLPGGVLAMTFYDCDRYQAMQAVDQYITCYTPGTLVRGWAKYLGFEEVFCHQDDGASVWIEFRKPGQLSSLRGGQALAKILPKPIANSK